MDATIVIPTYERHEYLKRQLTYLKRFLKDPGIQVIVADGSVKNQAENEALCRQHQVEYQHFDAEMFFLERWLKVLETVETDIVSFLADDDLLHVPGYLQAVQFLKAHPDYSAAHGRYFSFQQCEDGSYRYDYCYGYLKSVTQARPSKRLKDFFSWYAPLLYAVQRKDGLMDAYRYAIDNLNNAYLQFFELLQAAHLILQGKIYCGEFYYLARESGQSTELSGNTRLSWDELIHLPDIQKDYLTFRDFLLGDEQQYGLLSSNIDDAFVGYLACFSRYPLEAAKAFGQFSGYPAPEDLEKRRRDFRDIYNKKPPFQPELELWSILETLEPDREFLKPQAGLLGLIKEKLGVNLRSTGS